LAIVVLPVLSVLACTDALAKRTQVDFGLDNTPPSNNVNGEAWTFSSAACTTSPPAPASCLLDFNSITNSGKVDIGFNVNIGGTTYTQVFVNKNGIITFATGLGAFVAAKDFAELTTTVAGANNPFIAAFYPSSELAIPKVSSPSDLGSLGGAEYGRGTANPAGTDNGVPTDLSHNVAAFKATWVEGPDPNTGLPLLDNPINTRIVLYNTSATGADGDFDIRIEFGSSGTFNGGSGKNGIVGLGLGSGTDQQIISGSADTPTLVTDATDYYFHFCGGHFSAVACTPTVVDTDHDGVPDSKDNCPLKANPDQTDTDHDGVGDACDNCPTVANPTQDPNACKPPPPTRCDVDSDNDIDARDIAAIINSLGKKVGATDPRDANSNLKVDLFDAVICAQRCTRKFCAVK
jgi:hypothetical protein